VNDEFSLNREVEAKGRELGAAVPLERVIEALLSDAAKTWQALGCHVRGDYVRYLGIAHNDCADYRGDDDFFHPGRSLHPGPGFQRNPDRFFDQVVSWKVSQKLRPEMVRRLCVIAGKIPPLIHKVAESGIGADTKSCWLLLWLDAMGVTAPDIARTLQPKRPPKRDRIWKLRKKIYEKLARAVAPSREHRAAA
jgi:hypothetical protein